MTTIPDGLGLSSGLGRLLVDEYRRGVTSLETLNVWARNWRAAKQDRLTDAVEAAIQLPHN